jgi:hypothetical protein
LEYTDEYITSSNGGTTTIDYTSAVTPCGETYTEISETTSDGRTYTGNFSPETYFSWTDTSDFTIPTATTWSIDGTTYGYEYYDTTYGGFTTVDTTTTFKDGVYTEYSTEITPNGGRYTSTE